MKLNNEERRQWIQNDEGLYNWYRSEMRRRTGGMSAFIKENREEVDRCILNVLEGKKPAHYLAY